MTLVHETGAEAAPKPKAGAKRRKQKAIDDETSVEGESGATPELEPAAEPTPEPDAAPQPRPRSSRGKKQQAPATGITLQQLAESYLEHLDATGKSHGTIFSYSIEMKTAQRVLGAETLIAALTADSVHRFFECDAVMKLKSGRPKALPSFMKTRRVLRLALCWAVEQRWIEKAPLPEQAEAK